MKAKLIFTYLFLFTLPTYAAPLASLNALTKSLDTFEKLEVKKKPKVVIAVIDTGIDIDHPDLKSNLWQNRGEIGLDPNGQDKKTNGIDDDQNGFIDDVYGWNFVKSNSEVNDKHGHGSHISGIILGKSKPKASSYLNLPVQLMVLKYFEPEMDYRKTIDHTVAAIDYAIENGADIINYSSGGETFSKKELHAIKRAKDKGILFVTAAGNEGKNLDIENYYPAKYKVENIISVSATDSKNKRLPSSNFGKLNVSVSAPGENIVSTTLGGSYQKMSGTSQATAFITHHVALQILQGR